MTYEEALQIAMEELYDAVEVLRRNNKGYPSRVDLECNRLLTARNALHKGLEDMQERREWVGMSEDELEDLRQKAVFGRQTAMQMLLTLEAKLKEKNA